jgi:DNA-binding transcriptional ArsR family regulator
LTVARVVEQQARLDGVFHALADPMRRAMLRRLAQGGRSIGELASPFNMSFAGASKHVKALEHADLVRRAVRGRTHISA